MADEWDDNVTLPQPTNTSSFAEEGRSYGKGRGFKPINNNNNGEHRVGNKNGDYKGNDSSGFGTDNNDNWENGGGKQGGGFAGERKDHGGRGGGGGWGGGGGGFNGGNGDSDWKPRRGGRGGRRGGGGFKNREDDGESGGAWGDDGFNDGNGDGDSRPRRGRRGGGRGGGGGFRNGNGDGDGAAASGDGGWGGGGGGGWGGGGGGFNDGDDDSRPSRGRGGRGGRGGGRGRSNRDGDDPGGFGTSKSGFDADGGGGDPDKPPPVTYVPPEPEDNDMFSGVGVGINFEKYDSIPVKVSGENRPQPIEEFDKMGLRTLVLENVVKSGYTKPTPVQKNAIPIIMAGRDMMACAQTGSGKTAAFLVPIINTLLEQPSELKLIGGGCEPHCVVVSPTRELASQIWRQAMKFAKDSIIKCAVAYGGVATMYQGQKIANGCHILVATPGRLNDFVERRRVSFASLRYMVLDEADRMLDMGFLEDIRKMMEHESMVPKGERQTLMFSATFAENVQTIAADFLHDYLFLSVGIIGGACADVEQNFHDVPKFEKRAKLKELLERDDTANIPMTLVFVEMKKTADFIAAFLSSNNFPTTSMHGDRTQEQREEALRDFKSGRMPVLVATAVAARGLDIKGVAHVVNYDMPKEIDEFVHRIGRTGRVGNRGKATSFFDPETDGPLANDLVKILTQAGQEVPDWLSSDGGKFAPNRGERFGGRDVRRLGNDGTYDNPSNQPNSALDAEPEEEW